MDVMEPGYKMLGSTGTQYLNPDYILPLSTTLDSKNSPLALLAQTCSSIGKDSTASSSSSKLPLPSLTGDKKDVSAKESSSSSSAKLRSTSNSPIASGRNGDASRSSMTKCGERSSKDGGNTSSRSSSSSEGGGGGGGGGGGESSPKSRLHPSSRPLSSLISLGNNGSGKCTPSTASAIVGTLHRDYAALRGGGVSVTSSSSSGPSGVSLPPAINNNKIFGGDMSSYPDGYSDEMLKSGLLLQQQSLQEALRLQHEGIQSLQAAAVGLGPLAHSSGYHPLLFGHPLDPLMYSYSASLAAVHGLALNSHKLPTLSPYMGYARVSTSSDASALVPVCKDPFCATMPPSLHSTTGGSSTPCGAGCSQCGGTTTGGHDKSQHRCTGPTTTLASGGGGGGFGATEVTPFLSSSLYPMSLAAPLGGGLVNPLLGMAAAAHLGGSVGLTPYACSWLSGGEFCGKRFSKAEDLLQHLRTHASSSSSTDPILPPAFPFPGIPLPTPGFVGSGVGHPFNIPGSLSPTSLLQQHAGGGQAYPRSLSPNSLLSASRYHPYKTPFPTLPSAAGGGGGFAGMASALDAYYSSHDALFVHRVGAAAVGP